MAWNDLTPEEKAEVKADFWTCVVMVCVLLGVAAFWSLFVPTG